jgi:hypothetical protein
MGTPHRGSNLASSGPAMARLVLTYSADRTSPLLKLMSDSDALQALNEDFIGTYFRGEILSFYETIDVAGIGKLVEKQSTFLGLPNERLIASNANHSNLVKFATKDSEGYRIISNELKRLIYNLPGTITSYSSKPASSKDDGYGHKTVEGFYGLTVVETSSPPYIAKPEQRGKPPGVFDGRTQVDQTAQHAFDSLSEFSDFETGR